LKLHRPAVSPLVLVDHPISPAPRYLAGVPTPRLERQTRTRYVFRRTMARRFVQGLVGKFVHSDVASDIVLMTKVRVPEQPFAHRIAMRHFRIAADGAQ
jgi:hypothetical protein